MIIGVGKKLMGKSRGHQTIANRRLDLLPSSGSGPELGADLKDFGLLNRSILAIGHLSH